MAEEDPDTYIPRDNSNPNHVYDAKPFSSNKNDDDQQYSDIYSCTKSSINYSYVESLSFQSPPYSFSVNSNTKSIPKCPNINSTMESPNNVCLSIEKIDRDTLSFEQLQAANHIINSTKNVFITGAAGTGKSYLLKYLIQELKFRSKLVGNVSITASTGIAASHISGTTIHSYGGIGLGYQPVENLLEKIFEKESIIKRWIETNYLIIDEISMLNSVIFDKLECIARKVRNNELPFGGICLILCGDFFQLPPVKLGSSNHNFIFKSKAWKECNVETIELNEVIRQGNDRKFIQVLHEIRLGNYSRETMNILNACHISNKPLPNDGIIPTKLYCYNKEVDECNDKMLFKLLTKKYIYNIRDEWIHKPAIISEEKVLIDMIEKKATSSLVLKVNAQVMLTRNMPKFNLVNGSRGIVIDFVHAEEETDDFYNNNNINNNSDDNNNDALLLFPKVRFDNGVILIVRVQKSTQSNVSGKLCRHHIPLKLAWAFTIHKSQGMTISRAEVNVHNAFESGQVYVALSRIQSLEGLWLSGCPITKNDIIVNAVVLEMHRSTTTTDNNNNKFNSMNSSLSDHTTSVSNTINSDSTRYTTASTIINNNNDNNNKNSRINNNNNNISNNKVHSFVYDFMPDKYDFTIDVNSLNSSYRNISPTVDMVDNASYLSLLNNNSSASDSKNSIINSTMNNINKNMDNSNNNTRNDISYSDLNIFTHNNNLNSNMNKVNNNNISSINNIPTTKIYNEAILYFDGGSLGNPGKSGAGYQLFDMNKQLIQENAVKMNGIHTNNQAEYIGLIHGLKEAASLKYNIKTLHVYGDSELVIKQLKGEYLVRNDILIQLYNECLIINKYFNHIDFNHIGRIGNTGADKLSKLAMYHDNQAQESAAWFKTM